MKMSKFLFCLHFSRYCTLHSAPETERTSAAYLPPKPPCANLERLKDSMLDQGFGNWILILSVLLSVGAISPRAP